MFKKKALCWILAGVLAVSSCLLGMQDTVQADTVQESTAQLDTNQLTALVDENETISPCYSNITTAAATLAISGTTASARTQATVLTKGPITIKMQLKKLEGSSWKIVKTWTKSATSVLTLTVSGTYTVSRGTYKIYSIITVDGEEIVRSSPTKTV